MQDPTRNATNVLRRYKVRKAPELQRVDLFHKVMSVLASHHYRLPACRFVIDLFDKSVMRRIVLEESDVESGESGPEDDSRT